MSDKLSKENNVKLQNVVQDVLQDFLNVEIYTYDKYYISNILEDYIIISRKDDQKLTDEDIKLFTSKLNKPYHLKDNGKILLFDI